MAASRGVMQAEIIPNRIALLPGWIVPAPRRFRAARPRPDGRRRNSASDKGFARFFGGRCQRGTGGTSLAITGGQRRRVDGLRRLSGLLELTQWEGGVVR